MCFICELLQSASLTRLWFLHVLFSLLYNILPCEDATNYSPSPTIDAELRSLQFFSVPDSALVGILNMCPCEKGKDFSSLGFSFFFLTQAL